jgi:hypothetical protein
MANVVYNSYKQKALNGGAIDLDTDAIGVALVLSGYTPNIDTHDFFDDITNEASGAGYAAGGITLSGTTVYMNTTSDLAMFDAADVTWATSTITARGAVLYKRTGTAGTSPLIAYFDFGSDQVSSAGNFTIQWNAGGLLTLA